MSRSRQTFRSLAALSICAAALIACSSAELASEGDDFEGPGDSSTGAPNTGPGEDESESESAGDGDGDGDPGADPEGFQDPGYDLAQCDPNAAQVMAYDLREAQAELAPALVRESVLGGGGLVPNIPLGVQPFLNHFEFAYPPAEGAALELSSELWKPPMANAEAPTRYRLQYAIRAPQMPADQRVPVDLAIVVDLGPSMVGEPLALAEEALAAVEAALIPGDRVTLIGAGDEPLVLSESLVIENFGLTPLTGLLGEQPPAGAAKVGAALELAYETLASTWDEQGQPRVLLISNGHFQHDEELVDNVEDHAADGRFLLALGLGEPAMIADVPLRALAAEGRGPLLYDRTPEQLWTDLHDSFTRHLVAVATELEVTLELPPGLAIRDRDQLPGPAGEPEFGLIGANDLLVFHHELESCGELPASAEIVIELEWNDPISGEAKQDSWAQPLANVAGEGSLDGRKGAAATAYARALRGYRDGKSPDESFGALLDAVSLITDALEGLPEDPDLIEMSQVLGALEG